MMDAAPYSPPPVKSRVWLSLLLISGVSAQAAREHPGLVPMDELEATEFLLDKIRATKNNADFFDSMRRG